MNLSVPTNFQDDILSSIFQPKVDIIYGKLDRDFVGGGRPSCAIKKITKHRVEKHIEEIHNRGVRFYYLLNATCFGNSEWTIKGHNRLHKLLSWLTKINVDGIVVAVPYLCQFIKKHYPHFEISVSCFANINSVEKARFWDNLGVQSITLPQVELNRDFYLLSKIRKQVDCQIQLIVNDSCLPYCPYFLYHSNINSHSSQLGTPLGHGMFEYCHLSCRSSMFQQQANFIKATWIRPEDLQVYSDMGIDRFKLVDRSMKTSALVNVIEAYCQGEYNGNLNDLLVNPSSSMLFGKPNIWHKLKHFWHPFRVNIFKLAEKRNMMEDPNVYIDNTKLNGFIHYFLDNCCRDKKCDDCGYCESIAKKVVTFDTVSKQRLSKRYQTFVGEIVDGQLFKY